MPCPLAEPHILPQSGSIPLRRRIIKTRNKTGKRVEEKGNIFPFVTMGSKAAATYQTGVQVLSNTSDAGNNALASPQSY